MAHLERADMVAVLERTHLPVSEESFLLPLYESISNAIHAIQDQWGDQSAEKGRIDILFARDSTSDNYYFEICDNGVGLTDENYDSFLVPFTGHKLRVNGKGFGRFIAFKIFERSYYFSRYRDSKGMIKTRSFLFDVLQDEELVDEVRGITFPHETGCLVLHELLRPEYISIARDIDGADFVSLIIKHFLPIFVSQRMPNIFATVDDTEFDLKSHFLEFFGKEVECPFKVELRGEEHNFSVSVSRPERGRLFSRHALLFFADGRIAGPGRNIEGKMGTSYFEDAEGNRYVVVGCVTGEFLNRNANQPRTGIELSEDELNAISSAACDEILKVEDEQFRKIKQRQRENVLAVLNRSPLLRSGLKGKTIESYISSKPNNWKPEDFVADLALERYRDDRSWMQTLAESLKDFEQFKKRRDEILEKIEDANRDALAEYIVHRKQIIDIADFLRAETDQGRIPREDAFHDVIFWRHKDSEQLKIYDHNLWILDERLAYVSYISSDRTLHGGRREKGDKVTDLLLYDECLILSGDGTNTLIAVEFKRPGRDDYQNGRAGSDPIKQMLDTAGKIRETGNIRTTSQKVINVANTTTMIGYIVGDLTPSLRAIAADNDFRVTWDKQGFYRYHETRDIFIELISYDKLLSDAKKRNALFFDVLMGDLTA